MLSRRRSSEQASQSTQSTPAATRIENALRNLQILFSTPVIPDNNRPNIPRPPDQSGEIPQNDTSAMRRLFNRDQRPKRNPTHTLVVASTRGSVLRLYHVVDAARVTHRYWNLAELRKIDGLGGPVSESLQFALYFSNSKPMTYRTPSPHERAVFLWSLLHTCASKLKRAPPVEHLRLLDLQNAAETEQDDHLSGTYPSDQNLRLESSLEVLPVPEDHIAPSDNSTTHLVSIPTTSSKHDARPEDGDRSSDQTLKPRTRPRTPSRGQKVTRTMSEPKAIAMQPISDNSDDRCQPASTETRVKNMNIDERAFLAAAKRMGAKRSLNAAPHGKDRFNSVGSDPKARLFQGRVKASDANTAKVVAERRLQQEKKQFRLSMEEQMDVLFALELFGKEQEAVSLHDFGAWTDGQIQALEAENIADLVNVEKQAPEYDLHETPPAQLLSQGSRNEKSPQDLLVESMMFAEPWLEKCQTLLGPYAKLSENINDDVIMLERQRKNVHSLEEELDGLLRALTFEKEEDILISNIGSAADSSDAKSLNYQHFHRAVQVITDKATSLCKLPDLSEMVAVKSVHRLIYEKQNKASEALLPVLMKYVDKLYQLKDVNDYASTFRESWVTDSALNTDRETSEFLKGAECLAVCGNNSFVELIDHYVAVSSTWIIRFLRFLTEESLGASIVKAALDTRAKQFLENLLYICITEGIRAFRLFSRILDSSDRDGFISISGILRRQIPDALILDEYVRSVSERSGAKGACINLHFSHSLDFFSEIVDTASDEELEAALVRVETGNRARRSQSDFSKEVRNGSATIARPVVTRHDRVVRESVANFLTICNELSLTCQASLETQIGEIIDKMDAAQDVSSTQGRALFFSRVMNSVDLCYQLSSPMYSGLGSLEGKSNLNRKETNTKSLCERLIAAAMRSTEIASTAGLEDTTDRIKLQCYGYIAAKLEEGNRESFLVQLAHLSSRVRKHVMTKWADVAIFDTILGTLRLDGDKPTTETYSRFRNAVMELTAQAASSRVKNTINQTMETAVDTCAILPFYADLINLVKEKMEDMLRKVRKDRAVSDIRPKLLSFSRELLSNLRGEQKRLYDVLHRQAI